MAEKKLKYSIQEYLSMEAQAEIKNEYESGELFAMSGGTLNHGIIGNNINTCLNNATQQQESTCIAINGDVRIYIEQAESFVYPDAMLVCDKIETAEVDEHSITNPTLVVEVLSKSTGAYDRGDKFHKYCTLPSFQEYLLIDQYRPVVDIFYKNKEQKWLMSTTMGLDNSIYINSLQVSIPLQEIYRNVQGLLPVLIKLDL